MDDEYGVSYLLTDNILHEWCRKITLAKEKVVSLKKYEISKMKLEIELLEVEIL